MSGTRSHWEKVYTTKTETEVSWYQPHSLRSLELISTAAPDPAAAIVDIGGGASRLVDDLLARGYSDLTVLDVSDAALAKSRLRLGSEAGKVAWVAADITAWHPSRTYDVWHDRAVFHFLTDPQARSRYVDAARKSLRPGAHIVVATFGPHGPKKCSGLEVMRFTPDAIHREFGDDFAKIADSTEIHSTPWGAEQEFVYCYCRLPK